MPGRRQAIAGIVLGVLSLVLTVAGVIALIIMAVNSKP
jgi:hypothetical protein